MTSYIVDVYTYSPYKIEGHYREIASSEAVAMSRAVKAYRKEKIPRRKIKELYAVARKL
jgi:hypothetical protein